MIYWKEIKKKKLKKIKDKKYIENICSFDIETTSVFVKNGIGYGYESGKNYDEYEKQGFMYIWMFGIDKNVYYGRTWEDFKEFIDILNEKAGKHTVMIYVHNLAFEFQFMRSIFNMVDVFARKKREVITCGIDGKNVEFRCSYVLSGLSLSALGKVYKLQTNKMDGDLDYSQLRTSTTELTEKELGYCENDCLVVNEYIEIMKKKYGSFSKIPLTATGEIRNAFKKYITENYRENKRFSLMNWKEKVSKCGNDFYSFSRLVKCFSGGYVHANSYYANRVVKNVKYYDFTSSYPAVMLTEKFPMGEFYDVDDKLENLNYDNKCYILDLRFYNLHSKTLSPSISAHKANNDELLHFKMDNGRITDAECLRITCTEQDYEIIKDNYDFEKVEAVEILSAKKDYLPKVFIDFVINTYAQKKQLKKRKENGEDVEVEYAMAKSMLNSLYGMCITNYIRDNVKYNSDWSIEEITENHISEILKDVKENKKSILAYSWGVWISSYARRNIFEIINKIGSDYIYTDTDSVATIGSHKNVMREYNKKIDAKIIKMLKNYEIDKFEELEGIGRMESPEHFEEMKAIGAKRYAYKKDGKINLKVSGVGKDAVKSLCGKVDNLKFGLKISEELSGHKIKYYNDEQKEIKINNEIINEKTGICLQNATYIISDEEHDNMIAYKKYETSKILKEF